jgi:hypothetical protein
LAFKICRNFASACIELFAQKAQHIGTLEATYPMEQEMRIKPLQALGMVKDNIGCEFGLRGAPVVT